jgi:putative SOS response-associated peptidase YedK
MYRPADVIEPGYDEKSRLEIGPTDDVLFVTSGENGRNRICRGPWGLVPWRAKEVPKQVMFYARVETVDTSSAFKDAWGSKRCLIPANGFYAISEDGSHDSWFIHRQRGRPFSFAGLWAHNKKLGITSCTLITMPATEPLRGLHKRQPVILSSEAYEAWLNPATPAKDVKPLLDHNIEGELEFHRVARSVDAPEMRRNIALDEQVSDDASTTRRADQKGRLIQRLDASPREEANEILIDARDQLLARRSETFKFRCEHENCIDGAFWGYSQGGLGPRRWFCNEHRPDGEAMPIRQRSSTALGPVR